MQKGFSELSPPARWAGLVALYLVVLLPRLLAGDHTLRSDESIFFDWGNQFYQAVLSGNLRGTLVGLGHPGTTLYWLSLVAMVAGRLSELVSTGSPVTLETLTAIPTHLTLDALLLRRLPLILFDSGLVVLAFLLLTRLIDWRPALLGVLFFALDPLVLSEARVLRSESLSAACMLAGFLSFLVFNAGRGGRRYLWLAGVLAGLAMATRISSAFGLGMMALVGLVSVLCGEHGDTWVTRLRWLAATGLVLLLCSLGVFWLLWPAMWVDPVSAAGLSLGLVSKLVEDPRITFFLGALRENDPIMALYYPVLFVLKTSPLVLIGFVLCVGFLIGRAVSCWRRSDPPRVANWLRSFGRDSQVWVALALVAYAVLFIAQMSRGGHKYDHYIMPAFPAADIAAAMGLWWAARALLSRSGRATDRVLAAVAAVLVMVQLAVVLPFHPHYAAYASPLVGGPAVAGKAVEFQAGEEEAAHFLNTLPDVAGKTAAVRTTRRFEPIFLGQTVQLTNDPSWAQADFVVISSYHLQREIHDRQLTTYLARQAPLKVVRLGGMDFVWVYRGPQGGSYVNSTLTAKAKLLRFGVDQEEGGSGGWQAVSGTSLPFKLLWQNDGLAADESLRVRLVDAAGTTWTEAVAMPDAGFSAGAGLAGTIVDGRATLDLPVGLPPGTYYLKAGVYSRSRDLYLGTFELPSGCDAVSVIRAVSWPAAEQVVTQHPLGVAVTPALNLIGYEMASPGLPVGQTTLLTLVWQATGVPPDYAIAIQLRDDLDREKAYWLGRPVRSGYPSDRWQAGEIVRDPWDIAVPADVTPGDYHLVLAVFDAATGEPAGKTELGPVRVTK